MNIESIKILATIAGLIGSEILAFRVTGILSALSLLAECHEANIQQLMPNYQGDIHNLANSTKHVEKAQRKSLLITGFVFYIVSGLLQLTALLMAAP